MATIGLFSLFMFVGYIWLLVRAFKVSTGWGLGVMFLSPIAAIVFAVKHWESAKKPFALYLASLFLSVGLMTYKLVSSDLVQSTVQLSKDVEKGKVSQEEAGRVLGGKMADQTFDILEEFAETEGDKATLVLFRRYFDFQTNEMSGLEVATLIEDTEAHLGRGDLKPEQRQELIKMLNDLKTKQAVVLNTPTPSKKDDLQGEAVILGESGLPNLNPGQEATPVALPNVDNTPPVPGAIKIESSPAHPPLEGVIPDFVLQMQNPHVARDRDITFAEAKQHVGAQVILMNTNGKDVRCYLIGVSQQEIQCEKRMSAGTFSSTYKKSDISSLKLVSR